MSLGIMSIAQSVIYLYSFIGAGNVCVCVCVPFGNSQQPWHLDNPAHVGTPHFVVQDPLGQLAPLISATSIYGNSQLSVLIFTFTKVCHHFLQMKSLGQMTVMGYNRLTAKLQGLPLTLISSAKYSPFWLLFVLRKISRSTLFPAGGHVCVSSEG